jgi:PIN like domain
MKSQFPPGFEDLREKEVPDACGDYIGWQELMGIAKSEQKGIIFVNSLVPFPNSLPVLLK